MLRLIVATIFLLQFGIDGLRVSRAPEATGVIVGENTTIYCTVTNIQAGESVIWKKLPSSLIALDADSKNKRKYLVEGTYNLKVLNAQLTDEAMYECEAGGNRYTVSLTLGVAMRSLSLNWPDNSQKAKVNVAQNLTCKSEYSRPPATFRWFRDNVDITNQAMTYNGTVASNGYGDAYSFLTMTVTSSDLGRVVRCEADVPGRRNAMNQTLTISGSSDRSYSAAMIISATIATLAMVSLL